MSRYNRLQPILLLTAAVLVGTLTPSTVGQETVPAVAPPTQKLLEAARKPGPWKVATLSESEGIRNGPDYRGGMIHYPTRADGSLADGGPFPIVAVCPGYRGSEESMYPWGRFLASHGIVTITLGTNNPRDHPRARGQALLDAIETVRAENTREGSPLRDRLAVDRTGVAGWSMGGGGAQHAATMDGSLKGVVALLPWEPQTKFEHAVPVMILTGQNDNIASTSKHSRPHFEHTPESTPKLLFEIRGGRHSLARNPRTHDGATGAWTLVWLKTFVEGDEAYRALLDIEPPEATIYELSLAEETAPSEPAKTPAETKN